MKKILAVLFVALLGAIIVSAAAAEVARPFPQRLGLTRSSGNPAAVSYQDTITIVSAADSVRTSNITTSGWDWGLVKSMAATTAPIAIAKVEVWVDPGATAYVNGDSLNFVIEPSFDGGQTFVCNYQAKALAMGASLLGNTIVMTTQNGAATYTGAGGAFGYGMICVDPDANPIMSTTANFYAYLFDNFRLKLFGDAGAIGPIHVRVTPLASR